MIDLFETLNLPFSPAVNEWILRGLLTLLIFGVVVLLRRVITALLLAPFRAWTNRTDTDIDNALFRVVESASGYIVVALGLLLSTSVLAVGDVELVFIQRLARTLIIVGVGVALFEAVSMLEGGSRLVSATGLNLDSELFPFIRTGLRIVLIAVTMVVIIQEWGYDVTGLIAGLGLGGLAFSLAAQDTVSNLFGFSTIVGDRPFVVGEYIVTSEAEGTVERVGVRSTRIRTLDGSLMVVPNNTLANTTVTNWSRVPHRRLNFTVGLTYDTTAQQLRHIMERIRRLLQDHEQAQQDTIVVRFAEFGASSLDILVRCNLNTPAWDAWMAAREEINLAIMECVADSGLSMAFPSRSLYVEGWPQNAPVVTDGSNGNEAQPMTTPAGGHSHQDEAEDSPTDDI